MHSFSERIAVERARWLAELTVALERAQRLMQELGASDGNVEAAELYARIEAATAEVQALRLRRSDRIARRNDPEWTLWCNQASTG